MDEPELLTNVVFMGMGEPLANYSGVTKAMGNLIAEDGMNFSHRKVTLSTCGLVPQIKKLGKHITVNLAVSLNAADDETRSPKPPRIATASAISSSVGGGVSSNLYDRPNREYLSTPIRW